MKKPTMALISSWDEICGIAHYSHYLKQALDPFFEITVLPLSRQRLNATDKLEARAAEALVEQIASQIGSYDYVNVQFEPGLLASTTSTAARRLLRILRDAKNIVIAFHTIERPVHVTPRQHLSHLTSLRLRKWLAPMVRNTVVEGAWSKIFRFLDGHAAQHRVAAIAHTQRDARYLRNAMPNVRVGDTPLVYLDASHRDQIEASAADSRLKKLIPLADPATRYIGTFGFFSGYKGFRTAIAALEHLPPEYELLMFSSLHESALQPGQASDWYLDSLLEYIRDCKTPGIEKRVHFMGAQSDDDLLLGMMLCDAVLFPYTNDGHSASGPIAQALDLNRRVFASRNRQFIELSKYRPDFEFCDIGNPLEYAQKIPLLTKDRVDRDVHGLRFVEFPMLHQQHTPRTSAVTYLEALGIEADQQSAPSIHLVRALG